MTEDSYWERLDAVQRGYERATTERMESHLDDVNPVRPVPSPGEVHPAYSGHGFVLDWINGLHFQDRDQLLLPAPATRAQFAMFDETAPIEPSRPPVVLTRRRAAGPAPYVGRPFVYTWDVATDPWGRAVASEARIQYIAAPTARPMPPRR